MCCSSNQAAFAWIAAILINLGFVSLISYGAATQWVVGFLLSGFYTVFLLGLAKWLEPSDASNTVSASGVPATSDDSDDDQEGGRRHPALDSLSRGDDTAPRASPLLVSVLYGLAVVSLGVTGFFLPVNLVESCNSASWQSKYAWKTNMTDLPYEVRSWAKKEIYDQDEKGASFGYVESTGITLFRAIGQSSGQEYLWATTANGSEQPLQYKKYVYPSPFVTVSADTVCFQTLIVPNQPTLFVRKGMDKRTGYTVYCSDGVTFSQDQNTTLNPHQNSLQSFKVFSGDLWFKKAGQQGASGTLIYSLDPQSMVETLYSKRLANKNDRGAGTSCSDDDEVLRKQALWALLSTAIPMTTLSVALWKTKQISSMGVMTYISLSLVYMAVRVGVAPGSVDNDEAPFAWWFAISGFIWMIVSSHLLLSSSEDVPSTPTLLINNCKLCLRSGLGASAVGFASGLSWFIMEDRDTIGSWCLLNLAVVWPLITLGAATDTTFLLVLGGLGFLADAARLAALVESTFLGVFLVLCASGLFVGAIGYQLTLYQTRIQSYSMALAKHINRRLFSSEQSQLQLSEEDHDTVSERLMPEN